MEMNLHRNTPAPTSGHIIGLWAMHGTLLAFAGWWTYENPYECKTGVGYWTSQGGGKLYGEPTWWMEVPHGWDVTEIGKEIKELESEFQLNRQVRELTDENNYLRKQLDERESLSSLQI